MPFFDFRCQKCEEEILLMIPYAKDMAEKLEPCKCGENDWVRFYAVSGPKNKERSKDPAVRQAEEMMAGKNWT
jgi:hypothetical protein